MPSCYRGYESTGKLAVVLERCIVDVLKFVSLYILWNLGFSLAFYTMQVWAQVVWVVECRSSGGGWLCRSSHLLGKGAELD